MAYAFGKLAFILLRPSNFLLLLGLIGLPVSGAGRAPGPGACSPSRSA